MRKVLCVTENLGSGGAERQLTGLAVLLKEKGYHVKFIYYVNKNFYEPFLKENGIDYEYHPELADKRFRVLRLIKVYRKFKPDTVISFLPSVNITTCLARIFYKSQLIVSERSATQRIGIKEKVKFFLYRLADYVVANSNNEANFIKSHCPKLTLKTLAIPNFIDVDKFVPCKNKKNVGNTINILSVGRVIPSKNIIRYLHVLKGLVDKGYDIKATWVGNKSFDKLYTCEVEKTIKIINLKDRFILVDQQEDLLPFYQAADIFCFPTLFEGYPNVICEAMACQLPIVTSSVCEIPYIIEEDINGFLFKPKDVEDIDDKLTKMINLLPSKRTEIGVTNRNKVIKNNSKEEFLNKYIELINEK